jgi:hypothetical protein
LADLNETATGKTDMTSFEFSHSGCAWCHPGGGAMEYDREGFRYDGNAGLFQPGANGAPKASDYFVFDPATKTIADPSTVINGGSGQPYKTWSQGGVAEIDCLLCHYTNQYANLERNYAFPGATAPKLAASLGLVGAGTGQTGLLTISQKGSPGVNPNIATTGWSWSTNILSADLVVKTPNRENCSLCHFPDKSLAPNGALGQTCATNPEKCGPASKPLGFTAFQKYMAAGSVDDGDIVTAGGKNAAAWSVAKGRVEGGKRAESLNDGNNFDAHMKTPSSAGVKMTCTDCHYMLSGAFPALTNSAGEAVQAAATVRRIDHQFAKGNNQPDGKNMDQLDNTVTCESCHTSRTHPNLSDNGGTLTAPIPAHAGFPAVHFTKIDCKTCHIPVLNAPMKQNIADFTAGPYQTSERTQTDEVSSGVGYKPLYMWRATEHDGSGLQIEPITTMSVAVWANRTVGADGKVSLSPTFQRTAKSAAEVYRAAVGDGNGDGTYDWTLNAAQGGDKALIANTTAEIAGMVGELKNKGVAEPVMHFYFNQFAVSHNIAAKASGKIIGSTAGGGCVMCHASSDSASPNYSSKSGGFFDKTHTLFKQPADGGGLAQTDVNDAGGSPIQRVNVKFSSRKPDGTAFTIDLSGGKSHGQNVGNTLNQAEVLGYDAATLAKLTDPATPGVPKPVAKITYAKSGLTVDVSGVDSTCPSGNCGYSWTFGDSGNATGVITSHAYASAGTYTITLSLIDNSTGILGSASVTVDVAAVNQAPAAGFTSNLVDYGSPAYKTSHTWAVALTDLSTDEVAASLKITVNWGDGTAQAVKTGAGSVFTHDYAGAGSYTISYKVTDAAGLSSSLSQPVRLVRYKISGKVTQSDGTTAAGSVKLELKQGATVVKTAYTDASGNYAVTYLKPGTYTLVPAKTGYVFGAVPDVTVGPDMTVNITATTP